MLATTPYPIVEVLGQKWQLRGLRKARPRNQTRPPYLRAGVVFLNVADVYISSKSDIYHTWLNSSANMPYIELVKGCQYSHAM